MRYRENCQLLMERFPEVAFPLQFMERGEGARLGKLVGKLPDEGVQFLYVYGLVEMGEVRAWLEVDAHRRVILLEDDVSVLQGFLGSEEAGELLRDRQVIVRMLFEGADVRAFVERCVHEFPSAKVEVVAREGYEKRDVFAQLRLGLKRESVRAHALFSEALFAHHLLRNVASNGRRLKGAFNVNRLRGMFEGIPAVICGAGPSLEGMVEELRECNALLFSGGSTTAALSFHGIEPHFALAFDPNGDEYERLKGAHPMVGPFVYSNRLLPEVFDLHGGMLGYMRTESGGGFEQWLEGVLGIDDVPIGPELGAEAFTATTIAMALACEMGCNPILFCGVDLMCDEGRRYAKGVLAHDGERSLCSDHLIEKGGKLTQVKWVMEAEVIADYVKKHPEREFYRMSDGLTIEGVKQKELESFEQKDLAGMVHARVSQLGFDVKDIDYRDMLESAKRCLGCVEKIVLALERGNRGLFVLHEIELEKEIVYPILLRESVRALERIVRIHHEEEASVIMKWTKVKEWLVGIINHLS